MLITHAKIIATTQLQIWHDNTARVVLRGTIDESPDHIHEPNTTPLIYFEINWRDTFKRVIIINNQAYKSTGMKTIDNNDILILERDQDLDQYTKHATQALTI